MFSALPISCEGKPLKDRIAGAIPRADIWIYRHRGSVCREERLAELGLVLDMTVDLVMSDWKSDWIYRHVDGGSLNS